MKREKVCSIKCNHSVTREFKLNINQETLDYIIRNEIARKIAVYMADNLYNLPIKHEIIQETGTHIEIHSVVLHLIDEVELHRLQKIEEKFNEERLRPVWLGGE